MSSIWGNNIKLSIFGESHGPAIGINMDGLPPGIELDLDDIRFEMKRRAPGKDRTTTSRKEDDEFQVLSGYFNNKTTGTPLCIMIKNADKHSKDYEKTKNLARPGHADYTGNIKYNGYSDYRGGGHFSGRLTAPLVFAGAIAKQVLKGKNIYIGSHIQSVGNVTEKSFMNTELNPLLIEELRKKNLPTIDDIKAKEMEEEILKAREEQDSIGGVIEVGVLNPLPGLGSPFFDSVESRLSQMIFSIPGVKGIEFGTGFDITRMKGSKANDEYYYEDGVVKTYTNNNGGIIGGITNGMPIIFRVAMKPTPSIAKTQRTIDMETKENVEISVTGRHDPSIVVRAIPVLEAATALVILDLIIGDLPKYCNWDYD
ncbi:chorismate synthase [Tissierella sp. Yu-01]|uniref:chorismate synthase n=1 Tax=Tissierella sp. Yu-01 TaxID=3035694 RepID=UPI00240E204C|nr:chorismate synthase [Tissierella sp. Yu-01]WFA08893.1 chorismate synthase [Tissierella sp. Yu-01]